MAKGLDSRFHGNDKKNMNDKTWQKRITTFTAIFLFVFLFFINKNKIYESETIVLFLPKNEITARGINSTIENFRQILLSLAFNDRISDGSNALEPGIELPNYKRKEFWNSKIAIEQLKKSGAVSVKNFDASSGLARELNNDTIDSLIAIAGNYYNIKTDLEIRIIDGPIVKSVIAKNIFTVIWQSALWSIVIYFIWFFLFPNTFLKKSTDTGQRPIPGTDFSKNLTEKSISKKSDLPVFPEEENYFAAKKNIFSFPAFPTFGKKAPTPANLPVSEEEVPEMFREKNEEEKPARNATHSVAGGEEKILETTKYTPHEATAEEVKARLNQLLNEGR